MSFPAERPRRLRSRDAIRQMVRETRLAPQRLVYPLFVAEGKGGPVRSMPGVRQLTLKELVQEAKQAFESGVSAVLLFGLPKKKDEKASEAYAEAGIIQRAIQLLKEKIPEMIVMTDVCLCEYMNHGHCGIIEKIPLSSPLATEGSPYRTKGERGGFRINNDATLELLAKTALSHAQAGAGMVAPSDMMDGRITAIRRLLDQSGFEEIPIMSYAVKQASAFYGPFREAADSKPQFGDRKTYQMDPANLREALREAQLDIQEGADIILVKPALSALDIIAAVRKEIRVPIAAYQVSGEYAMIKAAGLKGWLDEKAAMMESLTAIHRAGADMIITYFAKEAARLL